MRPSPFSPSTFESISLKIFVDFFSEIDSYAEVKLAARARSGDIVDIITPISERLEKIGVFTTKQTVASKYFYNSIIPLEIP